MTIARRLLISGRVQGVCYRDWTVGAARALGVTGWVRNLADGRVEALAEGEAAAVDALIGRCRAGPDRARVTGIEIVEASAEGARDFVRR